MKFKNEDFELEEELDNARELEIFVHELLCEVFPLVHVDGDYVWRRRDLNLEGHVAPQVLELHGVVVLGVVPRHLVHLGVDALALPLHVGVVVAILVLAQRLLQLGVVDVLVSRCLKED